MLISARPFTSDTSSFWMVVYVWDVKEEVFLTGGVPLGSGLWSLALGPLHTLSWVAWMTAALDRRRNPSFPWGSGGRGRRRCRWTGEEEEEEERLSSGLGRPGSTSDWDPVRTRRSSVRSWKLTVFFLFSSCLLSCSEGVAGWRQRWGWFWVLKACFVSGGKHVFTFFIDGFSSAGGNHVSSLMETLGGFSLW